MISALAPATGRAPGGLSAGKISATGFQIPDPDGQVTHCKGKSGQFLVAHDDRFLAARQDRKAVGNR